MISPDGGSVFITSNGYVDRAAGQTAADTRIEISRVSLNPKAEEVTADGLRQWTVIKPSPDIVTSNGGTRFGDELLICSQGTHSNPSSLSSIPFAPPYKSTTLLNNFHGRQFNSVNDVVVLPPAGYTTDRTDVHHLPGTTIWFTDPTYGFEQGYRASQTLPMQVYCFGPGENGSAVRAVADGIERPNGIAFDWRGEKCYVTDSSYIRGDGTSHPESPGTIYVFDVIRPPAETSHDPSLAGPTLANKRVFAYTDSGAPDGIKTDTEGNVWVAVFEGIQCFNKYGTLIGRIVLLPSIHFPFSSSNQEQAIADERIRGCANFCFAPGGKLIVLAEDRIYEVTLGEGVRGSLLS